MCINVSSLTVKHQADQSSDLSETLDVNIRCRSLVLSSVWRKHAKAGSAWSAQNMAVQNLLILVAGVKCLLNVAQLYCRFSDFVNHSSL